MLNFLTGKGHTGIAQQEPEPTEEESKLPLESAVS